MWLHKFIPQPCFDNAGAGGEGSSGAGVGVGSGDRGYGGFGESAGYGGGGQVGGVSEGIGSGGGAFGSGAGSGSGGGFTPGEMSYSGGTQNYGPSQTRSPSMQTGAQAGTGVGIGSGDRGYGGFGEGVGGYSDRGNQNAAGAGASGQAGVGGLGSGEGSGPNGAQAAAAAAAAGRGSLAASSPSRNPVSVAPIAPPPKVVAPPPAPVPTVPASIVRAKPAIPPTTVVAPVTAANAAVYGPNAMMSVPATAVATAPSQIAAAQALASSIANAPVASRAKSASPNTSMGPMSQPGTVSSSGYGGVQGLAGKAASIGPSGSAMGAGYGGTQGPGGMRADAPSGGKGNFGGGMLGTMADGPSNSGPSFSGGPQSNVSAKSDFGVPGLNTPSGTNLAGKSDFGVPSINAATSNQAAKSDFGVPSLNTPSGTNLAAKSDFGVPSLNNAPRGLLSVPDGMRIGDDLADIGSYMAPGFAPSQIGINAANEAFASQRQPADVTVNTARDVQQPERSFSVPPATLEAARQVADQARKNRANPYGTPAQRDPNAQLAAYGQTNPTISAPGMTSPTARASLAAALNQMAERQAAQQAQAQRAQQAQASTAEIGGLLSQMGRIPSSASARTNEEMPGSVRDNMRETSIVKGLLDAVRGATTGGAATDAQGQTNDVENDGQVPDEPVREASLGNQPTDETGGATSGPEAALEKAQSANSNFSEAYQTAKNMIGMGEVPDRATLMEFFEKGGIPSDPVKEAWCATFVNAALGVNGIPGTNSKLARSFLEWGTPTDDPQPGDIVVFKRGNSNWQGHVGFFQGFDKNGNIRVLGGNQRNAVNVRTYSKKKLLGYRTLPQSGGGDASPQESELGIILQNAGIDIGSVPNTQNQQGYSQTPEGAWTEGAQKFSDPMEAVSSLPVMDQLRLWMAWNRGSVAPPEGRSDYDRGSDNPFLNDWLAQNAMLSSMFGNTNNNTGGGSGSGSGSGSGTGSGSGGAGGTGGGTGSGSGSGVGTGGPPTFDPPPGWDPRDLGLLYRPYSNPFTTNPFGPARNPWLAA